MAARHWRVIGVASDSGALALSALHLYGAAGNRVDVDAVLEASIPPQAGSISALQDADLSTSASWPAEVVRSPGFALHWTMGVAVDVAGLRLAAPDEAAFSRMLTLQFSSNGVDWSTQTTYGRFVWPGAADLTPVPGGLGGLDLLLHLDGDALDSSGNHRAVSLVGSPIFTLDGARFGPAMQVTSTAHLVATDLPAFGGGDFAIAFFYKKTGDGQLLTFGGERFNLSSWAYNRMTWYRGDSGYAADFNVPELSSIPPVHVEVCRLNGVLTVRVNGALKFTYATTTALTAGPLYLGSYPGSSGAAGAYDELAVVIGDVLHVGDFDPPELPYTGISSGNGPGPVGAMRAAAAEPVASSDAGPLVVSAITLLARAQDIEHGGAGRIWGTTRTKGTFDNTPTRARVVLLHQRSKLQVRETWSDPATGAFEFVGVDTRQDFLVLAEDAAGSFRPVAASRLVPEVAP